MSGYLVGIDLGTTHSVVAYADSAEPQQEIRVFGIEQLVAPGEVAARPLLPSMRYHPAPGELAPEDQQLPWPADSFSRGLPDGVVGEYARELGSKVPGRLVTSAKSWLSHPAVDRSAPILPWGAPEQMPRISPLDASASYLSHLRNAWNQQFPEHPLEAQYLVLTVPASFDEAARSLTVEAARKSGLPRVHLVEEPQAACYDWLARHRDRLAAVLKEVRLLLVCDVGGGTTDLSLIQVDWREATPRLVRVGVGDHLMLGGDNMDLALAHLAEARLVAAGRPLSAAQLSQLVQQCRGAKERLLAEGSPETAKVTLLGTGARLIGAARSAELSREEVRRLVVDGFFPHTDSDQRPQRRRAGLVEFGLPYASDPAITRHLAAFLADHAQAARAALGDRAPQDGSLPVPDAVLLNGGVFRSGGLAERLLGTLAAWRGDAPLELHNDQPELAVARGAVAYALARQGRGLRIGGGAARTLVLLVEGGPRQPQHGVCLLPRGVEEGHEVRLSERVFSLRLGQPVRFHLLAATGDFTCQPGDLVDLESQDFRPLPPLATVVDRAEGPRDAAREVPVQLAVGLTEVGTLEIDCIATEAAPGAPQRRWRLEFQLRDQAGDQVEETGGAELPAAFPQAAERIQRLFGPKAPDVGPAEIKRLQPELEKFLGRRENWDTHLLRELFGSLWEGARRRRRSADHERVWFNLAGYCLRPGYGYPLDDWRVEQLWSIYDQGVQYGREARNWSEWWILWRRVAGGLDAARQLQILSRIQGELRPAAGRGVGAKKPTAYEDMLRLVAGLERLPPQRKTEVGGWLLRTGRTAADSPQRWWALGRLGARVPLYGSAHDVVPRQVVQSWLEQVLALDWRAVGPAAFAAAQMARLSGDRDRDLDMDLRVLVIERLRREKASAKWVDMVETVAELDSADLKLVFGESLPPGLRLVR